MSKNLNVLLVGALVGVFGSAWLGQKVISWWMKPPVDYGINCDPSIVYSMQRLILVQAVAAIVVGLLFLVVKLMFSAGRANKKLANVTNASNSQNP